MTQEKALQEILAQKNGELFSLEKKIGKETVEDFCLIGFLKQGSAFQNGHMVNTWHSTGLARKAFDAIYGKASAHDKKMSKFMESVNR